MHHAGADMDTLSDFAPVLELGGLTLVTVILLRGMWAAVAWVGTQFLIPLRDAFKSHVENLDNSINRVGDVIEHMDDTLKTIDDDAKRAHGEAMDKLNDIRDAIE